MTTTTTGRGRWAVWLAGLIVVIAAGAATAHGLYEVAIGSRTPPGIAWLYPVITDGLALVAYAATSRVTGPSRRYAWSVVVLAAGLSGLAQATYLAGAVGDTPAGLRFGVGAWPAVAAAIAAHLLFLIGTHPDGTDPATTVPAVGVQSDVTSRPTNGVQPDEASRPTSPVQPVPPVSSPIRAIGPAAGSESNRARPRRIDMGQTRVAPSDGSPGDRARTAAELHRTRTGSYPTVRELAELADVGRGTADRALTELRTATNGSHLAANTDEKDPDQ